MHIGLLSQWYEPEPAWIPGTLARGLRDRGHRVTVVTGFPNYPTGELYPGYRQTIRHVEHDDGIRLCRVPLWPSHDQSAGRRIANYASFALSASVVGMPRMHDVDAFWVYDSPATVGLPAMLLALLGRKPMLLHIQDLWPDSVIESGLLRDGRLTRFTNVVLDLWCRLTYRAATEIAVISPSLIPLLESRGVPAEKLHFVPNTAEETRIDVREPVETDHREPDLIGKFVLMYAGSLGHVQGLDTAVRAAGRLRDLKDFVLVIVGSGVAEDSLRDLAKDLSLDNVRFMGRQPAELMPALAAQADAQLISLRDAPFLRATMPGKVQMLLAGGQPIIVSANGDAAAMIERAGAGLTSAAGDDEALAVAVRQLMSMPQADRQLFGERGRKFYDESLSSTRLVETIETMLARMAVHRG
jgi:putative colanic acid biosynthesis glycosyltransferase WcaI